MSELNDIPPESAADKPRMIIVISGHDSLSSGLSRRLMMMAAMQTIILCTRDELAREEAPSLQDMVLQVVERHPLEMPVLVSAPREIRQDYNLRAGYDPRKQDHAMMVKSHNAENRTAAKSAKHRHFHY